ncbi:hypothetical protein D3C76_1326370 [compost metagenome]
MRPVAIPAGSPTWVVKFCTACAISRMVCWNGSSNAEVCVARWALWACERSVMAAVESEMPIDPATLRNMVKSAAASALSRRGIEIKAMVVRGTNRNPSPIDWALRNSTRVPKSISGVSVRDQKNDTARQVKPKAMIQRVCTIGISFSTRGIVRTISIAPGDNTSPDQVAV